MSQADCSADKDLINGEVSARGPDYLNTCVVRQPQQRVCVCVCV